MADYTRYRTRPDDMPRHGRARRQKTTARKKRKLLWLKITAVVVLLLVIIVRGMAAGAIFALSRNLPSLEDLRKRPNAVNTTIYDRHGALIAELHGAENRVLVTTKGIPEVMKQATVATEDARFYTHHGVDFQGVVRAVVENIRAGGVVQGGSTITEQYVKNAYVGSERTYTRKLREAVLAWQLEDQWSKDKILTEYLNTVFYGASAYGVEAAALTYFHKHVSKLNLKEAALLAALPKAPSEFTPTVSPVEAKQRRNLVLQLMANKGYITQTKATATMKQRLGVYKYPLNPNNSLANYFTDYVKRVLTKRYGTRQVFEGGLKVYTSIDMTWQREATDVIKSTTGPLNFGFKPSAALVAIDPRNGYIRTMVGGLDYKKQKFNLAWQARRQPGSSMKPFVLTAAVLQGMNPDTTYYSSKSPVVIPLGAYAAPWVVNGDGPGGPENVAAATTISDNVVFAQLSVDVGPQNTVATARKMGITSPLDAVPSITLGTSGVTPLEMADRYATLASGGIHHPPQAIVKVEFPNGRVDWRPKTKGHRAIPAGVAHPHGGRELRGVPDVPHVPALVRGAGLAGARVGEVGAGRRAGAARGHALQTLRDDAGDAGRDGPVALCLGPPVDAAVGELDLDDRLRRVVDAAAGQGGVAIGHLERRHARGAQGDGRHRGERAGDAHFSGDLDRVVGAAVDAELREDDVVGDGGGGRDALGPAGAGAVHEPRRRIGAHGDHDRALGRVVGGVGVHTLLHGRGEHERLHCRARLTLGLRGEIELPLLEVEAADHGADVAVLGIDCDEGRCRLEA